MNYRNIKSRKAVIDAIAECDRLGRDKFLALYGFKHAELYILRHDGAEYDSKAILGVAHRFQFPARGPLGYKDFAGGKTHAARHLVRLGFEVDGVKPGEDDWTLAQVEAVVAEYFAMMAADDAGMAINKSERIRSLSETKLLGRSPGSVGRKFSNISAILSEAGLPRLRGYPPLPNRQALLEAVIFDRLSDHPEVFDTQPLPNELPVTGKEVEPPTGAVVRKALELRTPCRVDFAERDLRNRALGKAGEEWAFRFLRQELETAGKLDLASQVRWIARDDGDGHGYDILAFNVSGEPMRVEVKTTRGGRAAPFMVTQNEVQASAKHDKAYVLFRIFEYGDDPSFYRLYGALAKNCELEPQAYRALPS